MSGPMNEDYGSDGELRGVTQTILYNPALNAQGVYGNCFQAAVATVLELPLDAVPHFAAFEWWPQALTLWAYGRGLRVCGEKTDIIPDRRCVVGGKSPRGVSHSVVGEHGQVVWDPHPSRDGLVSVVDATWFEPLDDDEPCPPLWGGFIAAEQLRAMGYTVLAPASDEEPKKSQHTCTPGLIGSAYGCPACGLRDPALDIDDPIAHPSVAQLVTNLEASLAVAKTKSAAAHSEQGNA